MRWIAFASLLFSTVVQAASLDDLCPGASAQIEAAGFPAGAPATFGTVNVEFTVGSDSLVSDIQVISATHPAFVATATHVVAGLRCAPRDVPIRVAAPIHFSPPAIAVKSICPNYYSVAASIGYPRDAFKKGLKAGEVVIEFTLKPDGQIPEFDVMRSTDESFTKSAVFALSKLECNAFGQDVRVRVPFSFKLE